MDFRPRRTAILFGIGSAVVVFLLAAALSAQADIQIHDENYFSIGIEITGAISATSSAGRDKTAGRYAGDGSFLRFLAFLSGCNSWSSGLSTAAIMPVATCA